MDFDFDKFLYIAMWVLAIGATLLTILSGAAQWYYHFTTAGKLELLSFRIRGLAPYFRWRALGVAIFAWIAVFSFS